PERGRLRGRRRAPARRPGLRRRGTRRAPPRTPLALNCPHPPPRHTMRRSLQTLVLVGIVLAGAASLGPLALAQAVAAEARVIVKFTPEAPMLRRQILAAGERHAAQAQALGARAGLALRSGQALAERTQVITATGIDSRTLAE